MTYLSFLFFYFILFSMNILKRYAIKKIIVSTLCLLLFIMFYFLPTHEKEDIELNINDNKTMNVIYMLDNDNYVSRVNAYFDSNGLKDEIKKKIDILTNGSEDLYNFYPLIPNKTKLNSIKVDKNKVTLDFSKEFLSVNKYLEESMIEAILYTITEINGIDTLYINVEGRELRNLPNSHKDIPYPLKRSYGVNKEYNLNSLDNVNKTTVYFSKEKEGYNYYVPITQINNNDDNKIDIIIEELKSSINAQNDLNSYFDQKTKLINYNIEEDKIELMFNDFIFNNDKYIKEEQFVLVNSIFENYEIDEININNKYFFKRNNT